MIAKKIFSSKFFYIGLIIFVGLFFYLTVTKTVSLSFLGLWTINKNLIVGNDYTPKSMVDDSVVGTTLANVQLIKGNWNSKVFLGKMTEILNKGRQLVETDIIQLLENSKNKSAVLNAYERNLNLIIDQTAGLKYDFDQKAADAKADYANCESEKQLSDSEFFQGLLDADSNSIQAGLNGSIDNGQCSAKNKILANAYVALGNRLLAYNQVLTKKSEILTNNEDLIINNLGLFRDNYIEKLSQLKAALVKE